jgi:hypothetical protein
MPFSLLWTRLGSCEPGPSRSVPSWPWSWASVDGIISHRLKVFLKLNANPKSNGVELRMQSLHSYMRNEGVDEGVE